MGSLSNEFPIAFPVEPRIHYEGHGIDVAEAENNNAQKWEQKYKLIYSKHANLGNKYPNEHFIRFLATRKRRELDKFFNNIGTEDKIAAHGEAVLELMPNNLTNVRMAADLHFNPHGLTWSQTVTEGARTISENSQEKGISVKRLGPGGQFPYPDGTFQFVLSEKFGSHMPDQTRLVREVKRVSDNEGEIMIGYLSPHHGYMQWVEPLGNGYWRIGEEHPDPTLHGMVLFIVDKKVLANLWGEAFDVQVNHVDFNMHHFFSSTYFVCGRKRIPS